MRDHPLESHPAAHWRQFIYKVIDKKYYFPEVRPPFISYLECMDAATSAAVPSVVVFLCVVIAAVIRCRLSNEQISLLQRSLSLLKTRNAQTGP